MVKTLTNREIEVLAHLAEGKIARQVADALGISERTVSAYSQSAVRKLGAGNSTHAVAIAIRDCLIKSWVPWLAVSSIQSFGDVLTPSLLA